MAGPLTTPLASDQPRRRVAWRPLRLLVVLVVIALFACVAKWLPPDPLATRLVGAWQLRSTPSGTSEPRTIEFHEDGKFWVYASGQRSLSDQDSYRWRISRGDLVVVFEDPLTQPAPAGRKLKEAARRLADLRNVARSYRYAVSDDGGEVISIRLLEERGNTPAQAESATLTREREQPIRDDERERAEANLP
jgi:hypothetical protein